MYQNKQSYYYLAILEYMKFVPATILKQTLPSSTPAQNNLKHFLNNSHLHNVEQNLYLSSLLGHKGAAVTLGYMFKHGIGTDKNCSAALINYLAAMKKMKVDEF